MFLHFELDSSVMEFPPVVHPIMYRHLTDRRGGGAYGTAGKLIIFRKW
jgi:hypothetical protein